MIANAVPDFEGLYTATSDGRLWSHISGRWIDPKPGPDGYKKVRLRKGGVSFPRLVHRVIYSAFYPLDSSMQIDHKDGNTINNALWNLRTATHSQNMWNQRNRKPPRSGFIGVYERDGGFYALIGCHGKKHYVGWFATAEEAKKARDKVAVKLHKEFANV